MKFIYQTTFGGLDSPLEERGNCDLACLSTITGIPLENIPRYNEMMGGYEWHLLRNKFLADNGFYIVTFTDDAVPHLPDTYCIAVGPSPRGDWDHSTVGRIESGVLRLVHDPHPDQSFYAGKPVKFIDVVFRLIQSN